MSIGLDIGFHSIKMVELSPSPEGFKISSYSVKEIPRAVLAQKDRTGPIANIVKRMFAEAGIKSKKVYLTVTGHNVIIRKATLPKMPLEELTEAIKWNAKEDILFNVDDAAIDYHIMGETQEDGADFYDLLTVIVRGDIIPFLMNIVQAAGLQPLGVTVVPVALWDYDIALNPAKPGIVTSYVDMGAERTRVYFVCDGQLLFSREVPNGGNNVTESLVGEYPLENGETVVVDEDRAEQIKKTFGLPAQDAANATEEGIPLTSIRERMLPVIEKQVEEFQRSIDYFKNQYKKDAVHRLILSGGGVGLSGLYQFLQENLEQEIDRCNALFQSSSEVGADKDEKKLMGPGLTAAAGLALGRCDKINVLPDKYKVTLKKTLTAWAPYAVVPLVVAGLIGFSVHQRGNVKNLNQTLRAQEQEVVVLKDRIAELQKPGQDLKNKQAQMKALLKKREEFPKAVHIPVDFEEVLREVARVTDENTSLSLISYKEGGSKGSQTSGTDKETKKETAGGSGELDILIKGNIFGDRVAVQKSLKFLLRDLKNSRAFRDVKLARSTTIETGSFTKPGIDFEITLFPIMRKKA